jgi:hypothetical protein
MNANYIAAFNELKALGCPVYVHVDDYENFSIEAGEWIDYWSDWEDHRLHGILAKNGLFMEWVNPERGAVYIC